MDEINNNNPLDEYNSFDGSSRFEKIINKIKDRANNIDKYQKKDIIEAVAGKN